MDDLKKITKRMGTDYIIQEKVEQHHDIGRFHPSSLNTIRMMTLRFDSRISEISSILRLGVENSLIDNISQGGFAVGISSDGRLSDIGNRNMMDDMTEHPQTGEVFKGSSIPSFEKVKEMAFQLHSILTHFNIISWDLTVNPKGDPVFIEANLMGQGLHHHQFYNGPLFGDLTERILTL